MPYDEHRPPTSTEREKIYHAFRSVLETCYPSCYYLDPDSSGNVYVMFPQEVTLVDDEGNEDDRDRVAAILGGRDTEEKDLRLLINISKWRALSAEYKLTLLVHEVTHIDIPDHGDRFWDDFIRNLRKFLDEKRSSEFIPNYDRRRLVIASIHHVTPHGCDGDWSYYDRRGWVATQLRYSEKDYETFERLAHRVKENVEFCGQRKMYEAVVDSDGRSPYIAFWPHRGEQQANMRLPPEYIEDQQFDDSVIEFVLRSLREEGYPPLFPPVVEPTPSGQYRLIKGVDEVAMAQRLGLFEIGVINQGREVQTKDDLDPEELDISEEKKQELRNRMKEILEEDG